MKKRQILIITVALLILTLIGATIFSFSKNDTEKTSNEQLVGNSNNPTPEKPSNPNNQENNKKWKLFQQIKEKLNSPEYVAVANDENIINDFPEGNIFLTEPSSENKGGIWEICPKFRKLACCFDDFEPNDLAELKETIERRNKEKLKNYYKQYRKFLQKIEKLGLYYYKDGGFPGKKSYGSIFEDGQWKYHVGFHSRKNGLIVNLWIEKGHPGAENFSFSSGVYQIDFEKPLKKEPGYNRYLVEIETKDWISIKPYPNFSF